MTTKSDTLHSARLRGAGWLLLLVLVLAAVFSAIFPFRLIRPFAPQTPEGLEMAYALRRWAPLFTLVAGALALALGVWLWRGARRWWVKAALVLMLAGAGGAAWFARQRQFEWMFNPLGGASFAGAGEVDFVEPSDMVLAVELGGEAAAYPVRLLAYHHIVHDTVGGVPVVATY